MIQKKKKGKTGRSKTPWTILLCAAWMFEQGLMKLIAAGALVLLLSTPSTPPSDPALVEHLTTELAKVSPTPGTGSSASVEASASRPDPLTGIAVTVATSAFLLVVGLLELKVASGMYRGHGWARFTFCLLALYATLDSAWLLPALALCAWLCWSRTASSHFRS